MAKIPNSQPASYLTVDEFLKRKDWRTVADFVSDADVRVTQSSLTSDANLQAVLDDAAGMVEAACLAGNRYQPADLAALTGVAKAFRDRLIADLAMGLLIERRPDKKTPLPQSFERALAELEDLRFGKWIFGLKETQDAGLMDFEKDNENIREDRNLTTYKASRFFGSRGDSC